MMALDKNGKWKLDTTVLFPVSSDQLGGSYIDHAIQVKIERHLEQAKIRFKAGYSAKNSRVRHSPDQTVLLLKDDAPSSQNSGARPG